MMDEAPPSPSRSAGRLARSPSSRACVLCALLHAASSQYFPRRPAPGPRRLQGGPPPGGGPPPDGGGGTTSGTSSDACPGTDGESCEADGSTGYADASGLTYDAATGLFAGELVTNGCNDHERRYSSGLFDGASYAACESQTIPTASARSAVPTLGRAGMTLSGGVNIYSAFEAGFNDCADGMPCACYGAECAGGVDVRTCEAHLEHACSTSVTYEMFMDTCGGHADPYHIHTDPICNYGSSDSGHSTAVGVMLDGRVVYGVMESEASRPCDLDSCLGHVGPVPANDAYGIAEGDAIYHYHTSDSEAFPGTWTPACYGSPDVAVTQSMCEDLYDECGDDATTFSTADGDVTVDLYCPCFDPPAFDECANAPTAAPVVAPTPAPSLSQRPTAERDDDDGARRPPPLAHLLGPLGDAEAQAHVALVHLERRGALGAGAGAHGRCSAPGRAPSFWPLLARQSFPRGLRYMGECSPP